MRQYTYKYTPAKFTKFLTTQYLKVAIWNSCQNFSLCKGISHQIYLGSTHSQLSLPNIWCGGIVSSGGFLRAGL